MKSTSSLLLVLILAVFSGQFFVSVNAYAKTTPIEIPSYAKADDITKEIQDKGKEANTLALTVGVSVLLLAFIVGAILIGTGFKKELGMMVCSASVVGGLLMILAYPLMNIVLS